VIECWCTLRGQVWGWLPFRCGPGVLVPPPRSPTPCRVAAARTAALSVSPHVPCGGSPVQLAVAAEAEVFAVAGTDDKLALARRCVACVCRGTCCCQIACSNDVVSPCPPLTATPDPSSPVRLSVNRLGCCLHRAPLAPSLGVAHTVNYKTTPHFSTVVLEATGGKGVDVILDCIGACPLCLWCTVLPPPAFVCVGEGEGREQPAPRLCFHIRLPNWFPPPPPPPSFPHVRTAPAPSTSTTLTQAHPSWRTTSPVRPWTVAGSCTV
jgi:hypothetical protein